MIYFQSILTLYESASEERQDVIVKQLATFTNYKKTRIFFFNF